MGAIREFYKRITRRSYPLQRVVNDSDIVFPSTSEVQAINDFINAISSPLSERKSRIEEYDLMGFDTVIGSAVAMMAEDATQIDTMHDSIVWIESEDKVFEQSINKWLLNDININSLLPDIAEQVVLRGEAFLRTYAYDLSNDEVLKKIERVGSLNFKYVDPVDDISKIVALENRGKLVGYYFTDEKSHFNREVGIYSPLEFIHFCNRKTFSDEVVKVVVETKEDGEQHEELYKVISGVSVIDSARKAFRSLYAVENSILGARLARSPIFRLVKVEIGAASRTEGNRIIKSIEDSLRIKATFDKSGGLYDAKNFPVPINDFVIVPTRNGRGDVAIDTVSSEIDLKGAVDLDYFNNKLFAGLRIPKAFLGWEEALPGAIGSTTLTKLDARYARTIKRVQRVLKLGIRDMIEIKCLMGGEDLKDFRVCMSKVSTAEDADLLEELRGRTETASSLLDVVMSIEGIKVDKKELVDFIVSRVLNIDNFPTVESDEGLTELTSDESFDDFPSPAGGGFDVEPVEGEERGPTPRVPGREALDHKVRTMVRERISKHGTLTEKDINDILKLRR